MEKHASVPERHPVGPFCGAGIQQSSYARTTPDKRQNCPNGIRAAPRMHVSHVPQEFCVKRSVVFATAVIAVRNSPSSRRRGGRDLKKMLRSILCGADGVVVSSYRLSTPTVLISGSLKQLPRLRQQGRRTFSSRRSHPFFAKKGNTRAKPFVLFWTALPCEGGVDAT